MTKVKTTFFCQKCGTPHSKWHVSATDAKNGIPLLKKK